MLEIIVDNKFTLQLPEDINIQFIEENPLLLTDRIPSLYSLSFEVPATAENLKAFGYPNRVTSAIVRLKLLAEVRHSGLLLARGEILLLSVLDNIKLQFKGNREPANIRMNLNSIDLGGHNYGSFVFNQYTLDYTHPSLENYRNSMRTIAMSGAPYVIAPVKTEKEATEFENPWRNLLNEYINYFNPSRTDFTFNDPFASLVQFRMPILPFPYLKDIINIAFGESLENNPFNTNEDLSKLVLITMNHKHFRPSKLHYTYLTASDNETNVMFPLVDNYSSWGDTLPVEWEFKSFMQKITFSDLLKDIMKIFGMTLFPGVKYRIDFNNDIMELTERVNWNDKLAGDAELSVESAQKYVFKYSGITSAQNENPDRIKTSMQSIFDSAYNDTDSPGAVLYKDDSTGGMYKVTRTVEGLESTVAISSELVNDPLATIEEDVEENIQKFELIANVRPGSMNIQGYHEYDVLTTNPQKHWFVPVINISGLDQAPYIMFWGGMLSTLENNGQSYPGLMAHHSDHLGTRHFNTSLHPTGPDGLLEKFHGKMKAWVEKDKLKVKGSFRLSLFEIIQLKIWVKVFFQGKLFYISKLDYSISMNHISLVDVDLIEC